MILKKRSPNSRKKVYYSFKITEQEYNNLRSYLKANKILYKRRFKLKFKVNTNIIIALSLSIILIILSIIFIKIIK